MLAEILTRMKPVTSEVVSQGDTLPDSSHTPRPEQRCHLPGHREDLSYLYPPQSAPWVIPGLLQGCSHAP